MCKRVTGKKFFLLPTVYETALSTHGENLAKAIFDENFEDIAGEIEPKEVVDDSFCCQASTDASYSMDEQEILSGACQGSVNDYIEGLIGSLD